MKLITTICLVLLLMAAPALGQDSHSDRKNALIQFYQDHLSAADGGRCPMSPSCSEYAARAINKHGPLMGWIMACDRILRCGRSEVNLAPKKWIDGRACTHDPVAANDFWWFTAVSETPAQPR